MSTPPSHDVSGTEPLALACEDVLGRPRHLILTVRAGRVIVQTPPGQVAVFDPAGAARLAEAATAAAAAAQAATTGGGASEPDGLADR